MAIALAGPAIGATSMTMAINIAKKRLRVTVGIWATPPRQSMSGTKHESVELVTPTRIELVFSP